ncbi:MAG TPA: NAD(P)-dependent oxidoreductase, partial [Aquella sp.]|nr:NAD(P)-dependent oxidoreductase [Aquella sp.]
YLINTSRGGLVNESALYDALSSKKIAGAGLDVLETEPAEPENPLFELDNCIITPHYAWSSDIALERLVNTLQENIIAYNKGKLINLI